MASSPVTGIPLPNTTSTDQVPADLLAAFSAAELFWVGRFANSTGLASKITAPVAGMIAFLTSPGKFVYYDGTLAAWADLMNPNAWATWTPTLQSTTGTAFSLGAGAVQIGRYQQLGKTVNFQCTWNFGSSVSGPGGTLVFALPPGLPAANVAGLQQTGDCSLYVPNTGENYFGFWSVLPGGTTVFPHFNKDRATAAMGYFQDTSDGSSAGTGIPNITGTAFNYPMQINGTLTASGTYQIA